VSKACEPQRWLLDCQMKWLVDFTFSGQAI
jgi:hypothetical protein